MFTKYKNIGTVLLPTVHGIKGEFCLYSVLIMYLIQERPGNSQTKDERPDEQVHERVPERVQ